MVAHPRILLLTLIAAATCAGCPPRHGNGEDPRRRPPPRGGGVLRIRMPADLPRMPCVMQNHRWCDRILQDAVYEPLVRWNPKRERFEPVLATSWRRLEEGRVFQLTLREKVTWHNGKPFKAQDVKHTLDQLRSQAAKSQHPTAQRLRVHVERVRFSTDHQVEIHFRKPFGPVLELLAAIPIQPSSKTLGPRLNDTPRVIGTGPFRFIQWWPLEKIVISRYGPYWGRASHLARVEFHVVPSWQETEQRLRKGRLDLVLDLDAALYRRLGRALSKPTPVLLEPAAFASLTFNTRRPPFNDARVRQAVARLIDRRKLVSPLPGPRPRLLDGPAWRHGPQRRAALGTAPPHEPGSAPRLLKAAGWTLTAGTWRKNGRPLTFSVLTATRSMATNRGLRAIRDDLRKAGVAMVLRKVLWGQLVVALRKRTFDAVALVTPLHGPWSDLVDLAHSRSAAAGGNHAGFREPAFDKLLDRILLEVGDSKRLALQRRAFQHLGRQVPLLPLHAPRSLGLSRRPLTNTVATYNWLDLRRLSFEK